MRWTLPGLAVLLLAGCQLRSPREEPAVVAAAVLVEPASLELAAGESGQLSAQVNDALHQPIGGAPISFESGDSTVVRVSQRGLVTSPGKAGAARVTVSSGGQRAVVKVTVLPLAATWIQKQDGDGQRGAVRGPLPGALRVRTLDVHGNPVPGAAVRFTTPDGGSVDVATPVSDATGTVAATWTLGASAGPQRAYATLVGAPATAEAFTATAVASAPASLEELPIVGAPPAAGAEVAVRVRLVDAFGNDVPGAEVAWRALTEGATVAPPAGAAGPKGVAEARLTTAPAAGENRVEARVAGLEQPRVLVVTTVAGPPARLEVASGDGQTAPQKRAVRAAPSVRVLDAHGNRVAGVEVRFAVVAGEGSVEVPAPVTDPKGVASCGRWTLGAPGENALEASVAGVEEKARIAATARRR